MEIKGERWVEKILLFLILITIIYIFIVGFYSYKDNSGGYCGRNINSIIDDKSQYVNSSYILNASSASIIQNFNRNRFDSVYEQFCFSAIITSSTGLKVNVIDGNYNTIGTGYVYSNKEDYCFEISEPINSQYYIGLLCENCSATEYITLYSEQFGKDEEQILKINDVIKVQKDDTLSFEVFERLGCNNLIIYFTKWYMSITACMLFFIVLFFNYDVYAEKVLKPAEQMFKDKK